MARSTYVYVVMDTETVVPVAVFTVKHEMTRWLKNNRVPLTTLVYRYRDGTYADKAATLMDTEELFQ